MILQFWFYFLGTGVVTRVLTPPLHFKNKTITCKIRQKTNKEIHHFHFGLLILIMTLFVLFIKHFVFTGTVIFGLGIGLSLFADELFLYINKDYSTYFTPEGMQYSVIAHIIIGITTTAFLLLF